MANKRVKEFRNLPISSMLKGFPIFESDDDVRFLNVFRSRQIANVVKENSFMFQFYQTQEEEFLDDIASNQYGNPFLWWIIAEFNDIHNPYESVAPGESLKILRSDYLYVIFDDIEVIGEL